MINLIKKYASVLKYLIVGGFTTLINILCYYICARFIDLPTIPSNIIAWIISVLFAYISNRIWVFNSQTRSMKGILYELITFFSCRLLTGLLDLTMMFIFVDILGFYDILIKIISNIIVIILNYVASKFLIFKKNVK